ncbi:MAG: NAD(P)-binding domain-containing protein [Actinobacteria bacterium]|nr:NAD(P)-binding domain-containing protein [Actinomycetota bacterium]
MDPTRVGVIGSGAVGRALAAGFAAHGHEVTIGTRAPEENDDLQAWAAQHDRVAIGTFAGAAEAGEIVVLAPRGTAVEAAIQTAGPQHFAGKVVIDATNPLAPDPATGGPGLAVGHTDSGGEIAQRALPDARVVKAFNTVNNALMVDPSLPGGPHPMFIAGDDDAAKQAVAELLADVGWKAFDVGGIEQSRQLESLVLLWVAIGRARGAYDHAFTLVTPSS